mmetsp:Transcript_911/g.3357  ORF Transcript_911/g.3357 Transcript_911/m.3357 type:complete len:367 (+) Transcript_911:114-1214(+)
MHSYQALQWTTTILLVLVVLSCTLPWYTQSVETKEATASGANATGTSLVLYQMFYRYGSNSCPDASLCTAQTWLLDGPSDGVTLWTYDSNLRNTRIVFAVAWLIEVVAALLVPLIYFRMINLSSTAALLAFVATGGAISVFLLLPAALMHDLGSDCLYSNLPGNFSSTAKSACHDFVGDQTYSYQRNATGEQQELHLQWGPSIGWYTSVAAVVMGVVVLLVAVYRKVKDLQKNSPEALRKKERVENSTRWLLDELSSHSDGGSSSYGSLSGGEFSDEEVVKKTKSPPENWPKCESSSETFPKVILSARGDQLTEAPPESRVMRLESDAWAESDEESLLVEDAPLEPVNTEFTVDDSSDVEVQIANI